MKLPYDILYLIIHYLNDNYTAKSIVTSDKHMYNTYTSYLKHISCKFVSSMCNLSMSNNYIIVEWS